MNYKSIISTIALISLLIPILAPVLLVLPVATAQAAYTITNIYGTTTFTDTITGATHDNGVYPGSTIVVEVYAPSTAQFTVEIVNTYTNYSYVAQTVRPSEPGYVNVTLTLPKKLPGLTEAIDILEARLVVAGSPVDWRYLSVLPIIEVTPSVTTLVDSSGTPLDVTATVYGLPEGTSVDEVDIGPYPYYPVDAVADENGMVVIPITLLDLTGEGIPMGVYTVSFIAYYDIPPDYFGTAELTIKPQVVINPGIEPAGHGMFINIPGYDIANDTITVVGYGFPANAVVTKIRLLNTNFTNVYYDFPCSLLTDENGYFSVEDLMSIKPTNMTAGLYIPIVYTTPPPVTLSNTSSIPLNAKGWVAVDLSKMGIPGLEGFVNATSQINGTLSYVTTAARQSVNKFDVLNIDIVDGAYTYRFSANLLVNASGSYTIFALYNTTTIPWVTLFNITVPMTYDASISANVSFVQFNLTGAYLANTPASPGQYRYNATFYEYANQILLVLAEYKLQITGGLVTIVHTPSGQSITYTTENLTVVGTTVKAPTWSFTYGDFSYKVSWVYDAQAGQATLTVTVTQKETPYEFRNVYYLVRPILVFLYGGMVYKTYPVAVMPNTTITMIAFGYSPGYGWYDLHNMLTVTLDMVSPLTVVELGRDGNVTFKVTIPVGTTFGSHYIHGIDSRGYEYSVAIVVGAKAVFVVELKPDKNVVSASYYNTHVEACPCAVYEGKTFCDVCVVYTGDCDYLGDYVDITLYGLQPGEKLVKLYLDTMEVPSSLITPTTPVADSSGMMTFKFLVPSIPEGTYTIRVVTSVSGETTVVWAKNTSISYIVVKPKLLLVTLDSNVTGGTGVLPILVGPGVVRVIGTGFTPGVSFDTILVNMTDAFRPIYTNVRYWSVDSNGILIGGKVEDKDIYPAILFQVLQPGKYEVRLTYYYGTTLKLSEPGYIYVVNNLTYVATKEDVDKLSNDINAGFTTISGKLDTILGKFGTVLDNITLQLNSISTGISDLKSSVSTGFSSLNGTISTGFTTISGKLDDVSKSISDVASKVGSIGTQLNTVYGLILSQGGKVDTILSLVNDIHTNMTYAMIKLDKIDAIVSKLSDISTSLSTISSSINALSGKLDDVKSAVNSVSSSISDLSSKVAGLDTKITGLDSKMDSGFKGLEAKITSLDSKVDTRFNEVSSKVDSASGAASNSMYIGVIATFFALLAMVFALLGYSTIRKSVVPK